MTGSDKGPMWAYFHELPSVNQNHLRACCRACVKHTLKNPPATWNEAHPPIDPTREERADRLKRAYQSVGDVNGVASSMAAHILGYKGHAACPNVSAQAVADAKLVQEKACLKKQADKDGESTPSASTSGKRVARNAVSFLGSKVWALEIREALI
ncbi:hypothetical protein B0H14DRAFT_3461146 [Mycena olivaceomarginata]|nr:hypothetical protein B0H14DRAFT_3461146 [Mycena olivaceomarginata]